LNKDFSLNTSYRHLTLFFDDRVASTIVLRVYFPGIIVLVVLYLYNFNNVLVEVVVAVVVVLIKSVQPKVQGIGVSE